MSRISALGLIFAITFGLSVAPVAARQDATPAASMGLENLGLPSLEVTVTSTGYEGIPSELTAGRYRVSLTVAEDVGESGSGIAFVQAPAGMTSDAFITAYNEPDDSGADGGTPIAETDASPEADSGPPSFLFDAHYAGGIYSLGGSTQFVVDLTPGE